MWASLLDRYVSLTGDVSLQFFPPILGFFVIVLTYIAIGSLFILLERIFPQRKIQPPSTTNPSAFETAKTLFVAFSIMFPALVLMQYVSTRLGYGVRTTVELPSVSEFLLHSLVFLLSTEVLFFYTHWALHSSLLYAPIHKKHHSYKQPIAFAALYSHPVEILLGNTVALMCAPFVLNSHCVVFLSGLFFGIVGTEYHHSGLVLIPWGSQPWFHDWHHEKFEENYGLLGILDYIHGTDVKWRAQFQERRRRMLQGEKKKK